MTKKSKSNRMAIMRITFGAAKSIKGERSTKKEQKSLLAKFKRDLKKMIPNMSLKMIDEGTITVEEVDVDKEGNIVE